jgi:hypothetical protein
MFENLTDNNILLYAVKCYDKPNCIISEFDEDFKRVRYIKRLLKKYRETGELKERLVLNHIILLQNVFGIVPSTRILFAKVSDKDYGTLKPFLIYTSAMPDVVRGVNGRDVLSSDIPMDWSIVEILRKL